jgi:hypothetical protein
VIELLKQKRKMLLRILAIPIEVFTAVTLVAGLKYNPLWLLGFPIGLALLYADYRLHERN